jgi:pyruvate dehydrogenase phosphatase
MPDHHRRIFQETDDAMLRAFTKDHSFFGTKSANWVDNAKIVKSGCTALILDIDLDTRTVTYANAGDCRAVLSGTDPTETQLQETLDLNAGTPSEQARLAREHPGEELLISSMMSTGRLFGRIMSTRGHFPTNSGQQV